VTVACHREARVALPVPPTVSTCAFEPMPLAIEVALPGCAIHDALPPSEAFALACPPNIAAADAPEPLPTALEVALPACLPPQSTPASMLFPSRSIRNAEY